MKILMYFVIMNYLIVSLSNSFEAKAQARIDLPLKYKFSKVQSGLIRHETELLWDISDLSKRVGSNKNVTNSIIENGEQIAWSSSFVQPVNGPFVLYYSYPLDAFLITGEFGGGLSARWLDGATAARIIGYDPAAESIETFKLIFLERAGIAKLFAEALRLNPAVKEAVLNEARSQMNANRIISRLAMVITARDKFSKTRCSGPIVQFISQNKASISAKSGVTVNVIDSLLPVMPTRFQEGDALFLTDSLTGRYHAAIGFNPNVANCSPVFHGFMYSIWAN